MRGKGSSPTSCVNKLLAEKSTVGVGAKSVMFNHALQVVLTTSDDGSITVACLDRSDGKMRGCERRAARRVQEKRWAIEVQYKCNTVGHIVSPTRSAPIVSVVLIISFSFA